MPLPVGEGQYGLQVAQAVGIAELVAGRLPHGGVLQRDNRMSFWDCIQGATDVPACHPKAACSAGVIPASCCLSGRPVNFCEQPLGVRNDTKAREASWE